MAAKSSGQYKCTLSAELLKKAQDELHENPQTRHLEIKTFRERVESFPGKFISLPNEMIKKSI